MARKEFQFRADDGHHIQPTSADIFLRQQLEHSISKYFYEGCDRILQNLLSKCRWYTTTHASILTVVIECPDQMTNWQILQQIVPMANILHGIVSSAKIRVCPPDTQTVPFEMRVDELPVYRDWA